MKTLTSPATTAYQEQSIAQLSPAARNAKRCQIRQKLIIASSRIGLLLSLLLLWQFVSGQLVDPVFMSSPLEVVRQVWTWIGDGTLWFHTEITLQETLLGLFFGLVAGILAGFFLGIEPLLAKILDPFIFALYSIPKVALAPLFILWFGIDIQMKVVLASVTVFFLVFFNTLAGVRNVDQDLIDAVRLMGGKHRDILLKVVVPSAIGSVLTGVHIAIPYALIGAVVAELIASNRGIGFLIEASATEFNTAGVFAALLVLTVIAGLMNAVVHVIDRKTSRWKVGIHIGKKVLP